MNQSDIWKYCTPEHCRDMLLSFRLLGEKLPDDKVIACLYSVSNHTERHYKVIQIPKRDGTRRTLMVPDCLLKKIQKNILNHILSGFAVSSCATAYQKGTSVLKNASVHTGNRLVLKLDIKDFFGTISFPMVLGSVFSRKYFPLSVGTMLTSLCCCREFLPQGAPTSPAISNLVMKPFDDYMKQWCGKQGISYSRYCDDMTFSGDFLPGRVIRKVSDFLSVMGFSLNEEKTRILSCHRRQAVTGIVVNEKVQVSADYRRKLRQEVYYCLKFGVKSHLERTGRTELDSEKERRYLDSLLGKIRYLLYINPEDAWFQEARERISLLADSIKPSETIV
ncbi:reverse transcriptase family protein [Lacrimispora sp. JR3]|uniref:reverse transcriptase family protein n=1 Tax=Lacrimispora sinapis TaxID=3111456 RepID=UPI00374986AC